MRGRGRRQPELAGCDTMIARAEATAGGRAIFAKNSDRPPGESQGLVLLESAVHPTGARLRCQVLEIDQAPATHRVLGSRPWWLWGFEHGVNEHAVAIGNETVFGREPPADVGLLGMDLVRLGLERSRSAREAVDVITALIERHGQGGSGFQDVHWPYNNSFLVADPHDAWIIEAVGRHWATRPCRATDSVSNHVSIGADWDTLSAGAEDLARARGWWLGAGRIDFAGAFRDRDTVPGVLSEGRLRRSQECLADRRGAIDLTVMREMLRDHASAQDAVVTDVTPDSDRFYTICMHQGPSRTAAGMIVELAPPPTGPLLAWVCLGRPCVSVFVPIFLVGETLPEPLCAVSEHPSDAPWWVVEGLAARAERDRAFAAQVREQGDALERDLAAEAVQVREDLAECPPAEQARRAAVHGARWAGRFDQWARSLARA